MLNCLSYDTLISMHLNSFSQQFFPLNRLLNEAFSITNMIANRWWGSRERSEGRDNTPHCFARARAHIYLPHSSRLRQLALLESWLISLSAGARIIHRPSANPTAEMVIIGIRPGVACRRAFPKNDERVRSRVIDGCLVQYLGCESRRVSWRFRLNICISLNRYNLWKYLSAW